MRLTHALLPAATLGLASALAPTTAASPFDPALVAGDAEWVIHIDVEAIMASKVGGFLMENAEEFGVEMDHLHAMEEQFGIDPFEAIYGVTVYGVGEPGDEPIVVIVASQDIADAMDKASQEEDSPVRKTARGFTVDGELEVAVFEGRGGVAAYVVSEDAEGVDAGAAIITGRRSNLADAKWGRLRPTNAVGTLIMVSVAGSVEEFANGHGHHMGPAGAFLDGAKGFSATIAEFGGEVSLIVAATTADETKANGLSQMLNGLISMGRGFMQMQSNDAELEEIKQFLTLLEGVRIDADGRDVSINLSYDTDKLIDLLKNADL